MSILWSNRLRALRASVLAAVLIGAACSGDGGAEEEVISTTATPPTTTPATTTTTTTTTTTMTTTTTITATSSTTTTEPPLVLPDGVELLVAQEEGIDLLRGAESVPVLHVGSVSRAFADGRGGVVFQRTQPWPESWWFSEEEGNDRQVPTWPEGTEPSSIEWLPVLGGPTVEVVPADMEEQLLPLDVADLAGRTVVVYQRRSGVVDPCGGTAWLPGVEIDEGNCGTFALWSLLDHTEAQDLDSDRHWYLGQTGGWEWGATVRVGGDLAAIVPAYDWERDTLLVTDIDDVTATGMFRSPECSRPCPEIDPEVRCPGYNGPVIHIISPVFSPDGTRLAFMESHSYSCDEYEGGTDIVVIDPFTLEELHRSETDGSSLLDFNGDYLLFSDALVSIQPGIKDVGLPEANHYSFWTVGSDS